MEPDRVKVSCEKVIEKMKREIAAALGKKGVRVSSVRAEIKPCVTKMNISILINLPALPTRKNLHERQ